VDAFRLQRSIAIEKKSMAVLPIYFNHAGRWGGKFKYCLSNCSNYFIGTTGVEVETVSGKRNRAIGESIN